jgi:hypothetical protein
MAAVAALAPARKRRRVTLGEEEEPEIATGGFSEGVLVSMRIRLNDARFGFNPKCEAGRNAQRAAGETPTGRSDYPIRLW